MGRDAGIGARTRRRAARSVVVGIVVSASYGGLGCATGAPGAGSTGSEVYGAETPEAAVVGFLEAANRDDYRAMSRLFGTQNGPAERRLGRTEVEQRMFVLAAFLEHRQNSVRRSGLTEGPQRLRLVADLIGTRSGDVSVPFVVTSHEGRWYVERVITDPLTRTNR